MTRLSRRLTKLIIVITRKRLSTKRARPLVSELVVIIIRNWTRKISPRNPTRTSLRGNSSYNNNSREMPSLVLLRLQSNTRNRATRMSDLSWNFLEATQVPSKTILHLLCKIDRLLIISNRCSVLLALVGQCVNRYERLLFFHSKLYLIELCVNVIVISAASDT